MIRVSTADRQDLLTIHRRRLQRIVWIVLTGEAVTDAEISLALVDDAAIHALNKQYLNHDEPTDVITFPLSGPGESPLEGEIVISTETAQRVAAQRGHSVAAELALYVIHGVLHLCGYDDRSTRPRKQMREREAHYLELLRIVLKGKVD